MNKSGSFSKLLEVTPLPDGANWLLLKDFPYTDELGKTINVRAGFVTDFASIPRLFWVVLPKWGKYGYAAVIHDWLYWNWSDPKLPHDQQYSQEFADFILLKGMKVSGVRTVKQYLIFKAVRWFGFFAWYRNQEDRLGGVKREISPLPSDKKVDFKKRPGQYSQLGKLVISKSKNQLSKMKNSISNLKTRLKP
jgi:Protein of unknown function (DUF1353)